MKILRYSAIVFAVLTVLTLTVGGIGYFVKLGEGANIGAGVLLMSAPILAGITLVLWVAYYLASRRER